MSAKPNSNDNDFLEVFLIRHGQSKAQTGEEIGLDTHLSDTGKKQVRDAAEVLQQISFDRICVSPLTRAAETAEIIVSGCGIPLQTDCRLQENTGTVQDIPEHRAESLWQDLCRTAETEPEVQRILLVTHALFSSTFLAAVFGCTGSDSRSGIYARLGNARMGWIRIPRQYHNLKILAGWNFSPQELQNPPDGSFY